MGSGMPMNRKLSQIRPMMDIEYCRYSIHGANISEFEIPGTYSMLAFIRHRVYDFANKMGFTKDQLHDIVLAVGEAGTNAMKHGCKSPLCKVKVRMEKHPDSLHVYILDDGASFNYEDWKPTLYDSFSENGRGIVCMRAVMDNVYYHSQENGTCVELVKYLPPFA